MLINNNVRNRYRAAIVNGNRRKAAFTLVELLVVISIIGILVGLLLPAVNAAREAGRRAACANNIRQIALAATQYETSQRLYPTNWGVVPAGHAGISGTPGTSGTPTQGTGLAAVGASWLAAVLPNIEQKGLYDQLMIGKPFSYSDGNGYNNLTVLSTPVNTFICPSDTQRGTIGNQLLAGGALYATTNYKACAGSNWVGNAADGLPVVTAARGRNAGCKDGLDHGNGVICRGGATGAGGAPIATANQDIRDGASKTLLCGEAVPEWCGWSLWFWFDGSTATCGIPLNYRVPGITPQSNSATWQDNYSFMSRHPGGANFAACDGSGHFISDVIDFQVYQGLATIDGNESVTANGSTVDWPN